MQKQTDRLAIGGAAVAGAMFQVGLFLLSLGAGLFFVFPPAGVIVGWLGITTVGLGIWAGVDWILSFFRA